MGMNCFQFLNGEKMVPQSRKSASTRSNSSRSTDHDRRVSESDFNSSSDMSDFSVGRSRFPSLSQRQNNFRVFTFKELKHATRNFSRSLMIGEGGFGCVYRGTIQSSKDPSTTLDVAVKQLSRGGLQATPEYIQTGRLTTKSDIWSYGVVLYELITGRQPMDRNRPRREQKLLEWVKPYTSDARKFHLIVDPRIDDNYCLKQAMELSAVANRCLMRSPKLRPKTSDVLGMVQRILNRKPTLAEWAQSVGMSCDVLRSSISSGRRSRDKMIYANFRLVVHLARHYEGKGLEFQDLLQDNIYAFLKEIKYERRLCIQEGQLPTNEEIAKRVGITVKKLEKLLLYFRDPVSIQEHAWQDVTFQEITADLGVEIPDLVVTKQLMRQHVCDILKTLKPRERKIIQYRFGMHENKQKTLGEIGDIYGVSKERVRQLESRALNKLKEWCLPTQGLKAYQGLLL
ncbi:hypothetical protein BHE74_00025347 [Ensete ventricosum]|nr:hypothetical protein BHE74_00025347 [Ensete ventricosum]